ncbi:hypothetical protein BO82DRAFT_216265 [Aspergillus uvarum CBS 121591]|uniref:Uncharacterized protein n=1 Tax=Aspergillus uvarum CBS 121591 TaxID=1448315 RepID=A0A319BTT6_9EURO|nr:hypothetical protein BO82DRAFT_216265 [Aspergillus uvarum CBS 121591]PYH76135.1 hypothetical protein BO82DRAFT_216265 [Aspergillus uvarum CBS 121591]
MGSFLSVSVHHQTKDKRPRRSRRLSKPPPKQATVEPVTSVSHQHQPSVDGSSACLHPAAAWQNPWTGASIPINTTNSGLSGRRSHSLPSVISHSRTPWLTVNGPRKCQAIAREPQGMALRSPTVSTVGSSAVDRRASLQPSRQGTVRSAAFRASPQSPIDKYPKRSYSTTSPPQRTHSAISRSTIEEAKSSNTHFMVDSQGFSLIRRRSLLTRPGVVARRSTRDSARRQPPMIDQENGRSTNNSHVSYQAREQFASHNEESMTRPDITSEQLRPPTPNELEYTHLGALKLGSLRVVNGSTSPCPSDRARLKFPEGPSPNLHPGCAPEEEPIKLGRSDLRRIKTQVSSSYDEQPYLLPQRTIISPDDMIVSEPCLQFAGGELATAQAHVQSLARRSSATYSLQIPTSADYPANEDFPTSPFSFERSPTVPDLLRSCISATNAQGGSVPPSDGIDVLSSQGYSRLSKHRRSRYSHHMADSGHTSATSVHSCLNDQAMRSSPSQVLVAPDTPSFSPTSGNRARNVESLKSTTLPASEMQLRMHRQLSLQASSSSYRELEVPDQPAFVSSMCHDLQQRRHYRRARSTSLTVSCDPDRLVSYPQYCGQLRSYEGVSSNFNGTGSAPRLKTNTPRSSDIIHQQSGHRNFFPDPGISNDNIRDSLPLSRKGTMSHQAIDSYFALRLPAGVVGSNMHYKKSRPCPSLSEDSSTSTSQIGTTSDCGTLSGGSSSSRSSTHSDFWLSKATTGTYHLPISEEKLKPCGESMIPEFSRGRTRSRTIEHQGRRLTRHL